MAIEPDKPLSPPWACPACGAEVPAQFDLCWNCGTTSDGARRESLEWDDIAVRRSAVRHRRYHRRMGLAAVWAVCSWAVCLVSGSTLALMTDLQVPEHWTSLMLWLTVITGISFALAVGSTAAVIAFVFSPLGHLDRDD
jgi:hypothetical protein